MKAKVLLLEDDMVLQEIIAECLEEEGYAVVCCSDGTEAMDKVYEEHFDILLLDVMVSGQNGFEALRSIRKSGKEIPAILSLLLILLRSLKLVSKAAVMIICVSLLSFLSYSLEWKHN